GTGGGASLEHKTRSVMARAAGMLLTFTSNEQGPRIAPVGLVYVAPSFSPTSAVPPVAATPAPTAATTARAAPPVATVAATIATPIARPTTAPIRKPMRALLCSIGSPSLAAASAAAILDPQAAGFQAKLFIISANCGSAFSKFAAAAVWTNVAARPSES